MAITLEDAADLGFGAAAMHCCSHAKRSTPTVLRTVFRHFLLLDGFGKWVASVSSTFCSARALRKALAMNFERAKTLMVLSLSGA
ncbi:hypothetical protein SS05631_a43390 (plasmid) [Sinorhizobium sp. CCBAU 05631]|nr:hypothetical protein SS05631_a43390 [Sinorhizobium sp. CCBAU 05631]